MKIIFFGSSEYCLPILDSLLKNFQLLTVVTKQASAAQQFAKLHNIAVFTPKDKKGLLELKDQISSLEPDLAIVADYGLIIPEEIFEIPQCKTLNIHFSRLPALRGPSPVQFTILTGEKSAWITVIIMAKEMDTGDIIWQKEVPLDSGKSTNYPINKLSNQQIGETTGSLYKKLFNIIALELPDIVNKYIKGEIKPQKQDHSKATYTKILTREDGYIPPDLINAAMNGLPATIEQLGKWILIKQLSSQLTINNYQLSIERAIRAFTPWPGVWTIISLIKGRKDTSDGGEATTSTPPRWRDQNNRRLKILKVHLASQGETLQGKLILDLVQLEGKNPVSWKQFKEGYPNFTF